VVRYCSLFLFLGTALLAGCGGSSSGISRVPCHPAKGSLFIGDKPATGASVFFVPTKETPESQTPRPRGTVGADGTFRLSTFDTDDGAPAGEYGLIIFWPGQETDDRLNGRYDSPEKSKQTVKIAVGSNEIPPIKLK